MSLPEPSQGTAPVFKLVRQEPDGTIIDPSAITDSSDRQALRAILDTLIPPPNFRVVLDMDRETERLRLRVLKINPWQFKLFGIIPIRGGANWENVDALQRELKGPTYRSILLQLREQPEFLEFEMAVAGRVQMGPVFV